MSSLPPRQPNVDQHNLSQAGNLAHATQKVNRFAKRDPALYPLAFIVTGVLGAAGYFFMSKSTEVEPHRQLMANGVINPWDDKSKHDVHPSAVAAFKYRHKNKNGDWEDALPAISGETRTLNSPGPHKFHT